MLLKLPLETKKMIPTAKLRAEYHMTNPPKLIGFHVIVDGKTVALLTPDEVASVMTDFIADNLPAEFRPMRSAP
jgi:hypothetical protein